MQRTYNRLNIDVQPLQIKHSDLNTKRMIELMAVKSDEPVPLYMHTIYRVLREMRLTQQESGGKFDYGEFKRQIMNSGLMPAQVTPLTQRLETLESFMPNPPRTFPERKRERATVAPVDDTWGSKVRFSLFYGLANVYSLDNSPS